MLSDSIGWYNCFKNNKNFLKLKKLYFLRIATETLQTSLPGGAAYAELIRPYLLKKHIGFEYPETISANIITKINILIAQIIFLFAGVLIIIINFKTNILSVKFLTGSSLYIIAAISISFIFVFSYLLYRRNLLLHIMDGLDKINVKIVKKFSNKIRYSSIEINETLSSFSKEKKSGLFLSTLFFFCTWIIMAFESLVILKVMGIDASIYQTIMLESLISIVRIVFFFLPGAVGPQDVSIIMIFNLAGLPDPMVNSILFVVFKRLKELIWIIIGYILLIYFGVGINKLSGMKQREPVLN